MNNPFEALSSQLNRIEALLIEVRKSESLSYPKTETDSTPILTAQQASVFLNLKVSTVYALVHRSEIPYSKKCNKLYFLKADLIDWVLSGKRKTRTDFEKDAVSYLLKKAK